MYIVHRTSTEAEILHAAVNFTVYNDKQTASITKL